jgi:hypothetical protein
MKNEKYYSRNANVSTVAHKVTCLNNAPRRAKQHWQLQLFEQQRPQQSWHQRMMGLPYQRNKEAEEELPWI